MKKPENMVDIVAVVRVSLDIADRSGPIMRGVDVHLDLTDPIQRENFTEPGTRRLNREASDTLLNVLIQGVMAQVEYMAQIDGRDRQKLVDFVFTECNRHMESYHSIIYQST